MSFVDSVELEVQAGKGGDGIVSFRRERFVDRGGPDGGDGGDGGDVILTAKDNVNSLSAFRHQPLIQAKNGQPGGKARRHGKNGQDIEIFAPVGTVVVKDHQDLADLTEEGQSIVLAFGGKGGFGNAHFKSSRRQAPRVAENGEAGEHHKLILELKMIADVGIIGLPNAGKSTLLSVISNAKPAIAEYAFTTLVPNLGVVDVDGQSLLVADIPGIIEGASAGKGLGHDFLKHIERTQVLLHMIDVYSSDILSDYQTINNELKTYSSKLSNKAQVIALNKCEGLDKATINEQKSKLEAVTDAKVLAISAQAGQGVKPLIRHLQQVVSQAAAAEEEVKTADEADEDTIYVGLDQEPEWQVDKTEEGFVVHGTKIDKFAKRTNFQNEFGVERLIDIMKKLGIIHELNRQGYQNNQQVFLTKSKKYRLPKGQI